MRIFKSLLILIVSLWGLMALLVRSATGQPQTCYTSFYSGPRREADIDGPLETHIVLLDNRIVTKRYGRLFLKALLDAPVELF